MIEFESYQFDNGLKLVVHEDNSTPLVAINILYKVGSKDEKADKTGFAHLFEHLMFSGSENVKDFDVPIQMAGGENNAFTNSDITNFYNLVPVKNIETVLWLESDRMASLDISQKNLDIQKKVVIEEFKEVSLNQPYGDMWHHMSELAYKVHSYQWPTIGKDFSHIEQADLSQVRDFYHQYYNPKNAIITIVGNIKAQRAYELVEKYFAWIENFSSELQIGQNQQEPVQKTLNHKTLKSNVPANALYMGFHMKERLHREYAVADLLSDILSNGRSSRFFKNLYKKTSYFSTIDAYISGTFDPGLLMVEAKLHQDVEPAFAVKLIWEELEKVKNSEISQDELHKLLNKIESAQVYSEVNIMNKAMNLGYYTCLGDTQLINQQFDLYQSITPEEIQAVAKKILVPENCTEIIYEATHNEIK